MTPKCDSSELEIRCPTRYCRPESLIMVTSEIWGRRLNSRGSARHGISPRMHNSFAWCGIRLWDWDSWAMNWSACELRTYVRVYSHGAQIASHARHVSPMAASVFRSYDTSVGASSGPEKEMLTDPSNSRTRPSNTSCGTVPPDSELIAPIASAG